MIFRRQSVRPPGRFWSGPGRGDVSRWARRDELPSLHAYRPRLLRGGFSSLRRSHPGSETGGRVFRRNGERKGQARLDSAHCGAQLVGGAVFPIRQTRHQSGGVFSGFPGAGRCGGGSGAGRTVASVAAQYIRRQMRPIRATRMPIRIAPSKVRITRIHFSPALRRKA